jgi:hypothetical protein
VSGLTGSTPQQRLTLQKHKTRFFDPNHFVVYCRQMIEDRPINKEEEALLSVVRKYSGGSPYKTISYNQISADDWNSFSDDVIKRSLRNTLKPMRSITSGYAGFTAGWRRLGILEVSM